MHKKICGARGSVRTLLPSARSTAGLRITWSPLCVPRTPFILITWPKHEVEVGVRRNDQDRAGRLLGDVIDQRSTQLRWQLLARAGLWLILRRKGGIARIDIIILRAYLAALDCERDKQGRDQAGSGPRSGCMISQTILAH